MKKRHPHIGFVFLAAGTIVMALAQMRARPAAAQTAVSPTGTASLAERYRDDFLIGVAFDFIETNPITAEEQAIIKKQFNVVTPENSMKPISTHPAEDRWNWALADTLVDFCQTNKMK